MTSARRGLQRRLVQRAARGGRPADRRDRGVQFGGRPVRQRRADRLQRRERPAVQGDQQLPAQPSGRELQERSGSVR